MLGGAGHAECRQTRVLLGKHLPELLADFGDFGRDFDGFGMRLLTLFVALPHERLSYGSLSIHVFDKTSDDLLPDLSRSVCFANRLGDRSDLGE